MLWWEDSESESRTHGSLKRLAERQVVATTIRIAPFFHNRIPTRAP
jgi:hypothetical protein